MHKGFVCLQEASQFQNLPRFEMNSVARALSRTTGSNLSSWKLVVLQSYATSASKSKRSAPKRLPDFEPSSPATVEKPSPSPPPSPHPPQLPCPTEIPFQKKVANSVSLIGVVSFPVQSVTAPDGNLRAGTAITVKNTSSETPHLRIPVQFEGDLAHVATLHLKENDRVCIQGELVNIEEELAAELCKSCLTTIQVKVQNVNFVGASSPTIADSFRQTPTQALPRSNSTEGVENLSDSPWKDILDNPKEWSDYRSKKLDGSVKPKHPDFKRRNGGLAVWLNKAPEWFLSALGQSVFGNPIGKTNDSSLQKELGGAEIGNPIKAKQAKPGDEAWKDLICNPAKWWDNRLDKRNMRAPDFKHKETGVALWIDRAPVWVRSELPPPKEKVDKKSKQ